MTIAKKSLLDAAKAVVENWYQNKAVVDSIDDLRQAVQDAEVYTPMTDDEWCILYATAGGIDQRYSAEKYAERAVIERLGLRWPE